MYLPSPFQGKWGGSNQHPPHPRPPQAFLVNCAQAGVTGVGQLPVHRSRNLPARPDNTPAWRLEGPEEYELQGCFAFYTGDLDTPLSRGWAGLWTGGCQTLRSFLPGAWSIVPTIDALLKCVCTVQKYLPEIYSSFIYAFYLFELPIVIIVLSKMSIGFQNKINFCLSFFLPSCFVPFSFLFLFYFEFPLRPSQEKSTWFH